MDSFPQKGAVQSSTNWKFYGTCQAEEPREERFHRVDRSVDATVSHVKY